MLLVDRMWRSALTMLAVPVITVSVVSASVPAAWASAATGKVKAGASIGAVGSPLLGDTLYKGTAATVSGQAWYQLDKTGAKTATVHVKDTSGSGSSCTSLVVDLDNANGVAGNVSQTILGDNGAVSLPVTTAGLYYIELSGNGCSPTTATTYSIEPEPSAAWTAPAPPTAGTTKAGVSIGAVGPPLLGDTLYKGTAAIVSGQAWYQLDKTGAKTATVRVEDTTVNGSTNCTSLVVDLDNANGVDGNVSQTILGDNGAVNLPVTTAGLYYIELSGNGCSPTTATTHSIEPENSAAWTTPSPPATGTTKAGTSIGTVGSPLRGHKLYPGTAATKSEQAWYQLDKTGATTATVRVEDTTVNGSTNCTSLVVDLDNANGADGNVSQTILGDNGAVNLPVTTAGLYYIELSGNGCSPTTATTHSIEPENSAAWTTPSPPATGTTKAGASMATVGPPLLGDTLYKGTPATSTGEAWYQVHKKGNTTATVRVEDTTVNGSASCTSLVADLDNGSGTVLSQTILGDNGAVNVPVTTAGLYYIELSGNGCSPTSATAYSIEPVNSAAWTAATP